MGFLEINADYGCVLYSSIILEIEQQLMRSVSSTIPTLYFSISSRASGTKS